MVSGISLDIDLFWYQTLFVDSSTSLLMIDFAVNPETFTLIFQNDKTDKEATMLFSFSVFSVLLSYSRFA